MMDGSWRRIRALIRKEVYQIVRDPSSLLIGIAMPLLLLFLYGYGVSLDINHLRVGLVLEDTSPEAQSFAKALTGSRYFDVTVARHRDELVDDLIAGHIRGIIVVPAYFSAFRHSRAEKAPIQVIADGSEPNTASFVHNYVSGALQSWLAVEAAESALPRGRSSLPLVSLLPRFWYNEQLESRNFLIPGSLALIMTLIGTLLTALVVAREWERGTMEALMSTPVTIREILIGKLVPYFFFGMLSLGMCIVVSVWFYEVSLRGSIAVLTLVSSVFLITSLALGLLISTIARSQFVAAQASQVIAYLPAFMLSGFIFEIANMPTIIQWITYIMPARYFVSSLQTIFLVGDVWPLLFWNLIPMFIQGMLIIGVTVAITKKRLD